MVAIQVHWIYMAQWVHTKWRAMDKARWWQGACSFKFTLQIMNVPHPNSIKNSTLLAVYRAGDSVYNLHTALDQFKEQFEEMDGMKWSCEKNKAYVIADLWPRMRKGTPRRTFIFLGISKSAHQFCFCSNGDYCTIVKIYPLPSVYSKNDTRVRSGLPARSVLF